MEPLRGYLHLAEKLVTEGPRFSEAWNFGPNDQDAKPVQWIVEHLTQNWGNGASWLVDNSHHPHEAHYLKLDCSKAKSRLNWQPRWHLAEALEHIISWQKQYQQGADIKAVTLAQINEYQSTSTHS